MLKPPTRPPEVFCSFGPGRVFGWRGPGGVGENSSTFQMSGRTKMKDGCHWTLIKSIGWNTCLSFWSAIGSKGKGIHCDENDFTLPEANKHGQCNIPEIPSNLDYVQARSVGFHRLSIAGMRDPVGSHVCTNEPPLIED